MQIRPQHFRDHKSVTPYGLLEKHDNLMHVLGAGNAEGFETSLPNILRAHTIVRPLGEI